jgi:hypothetical protein
MCHGVAGANELLPPEIREGSTRQTLGIKYCKTSNFEPRGSSKDALGSVPGRRSDGGFIGGGCDGEADHAGVGCFASHVLPKATCGKHRFDDAFDLIGVPERT